MNRRRIWLLAGVGATVLAAGIVATTIAVSTRSDGGDVEDVDRSNPEAVATAFMQAFATNDPQMCALADADMLGQLQRDRRCDLAPSGTRPRLAVVDRGYCPPPSPTDSRYSASVTPSGAYGTAYATVYVKDIGGQWAVTGSAGRSAPATNDPGRCAPPSSNYGG